MKPENNENTLYSLAETIHSLHRDWRLRFKEKFVIDPRQCFVLWYLYFFGVPFWNRDYVRGKRVRQKSWATTRHDVTLQCGHRLSLFNKSSLSTKLLDGLLSRDLVWLGSLPLSERTKLFGAPGPRGAVILQRAGAQEAAKLTFIVERYIACRHDEPEAFVALVGKLPTLLRQLR